jgi:DNA polymerase-1
VSDRDPSQLPNEQETILLVDASGLLYRSFFALPPLTSPSGRPTGALYGFIRSFLKVLQKITPTHFVSVFDGPNNKQSRLAYYPEYKAHRKPTPPELIEQIEEAKKFCSLWGIPSLSHAGVEADDTIASIVSWCLEKTDLHVCLCSADKDLAQLVDSRVTIINPAKDDAIIDENAVIAEWGMHPKQLRDFFALIGDASDNVPGIEGIGPKTAKDLLATWGTLDNLLANAEAVPGKKGERLQTGKEIALLSRRLVTLDTSVDVPHDLSFYTKQDQNLDALQQYFHEKGFKTLESLISTQKLPAAPAACQHTTVQTQEEFDHFCSWLSSQERIAIDCETTSLDEYSAELVGIGIASSPDHVFYINCRGALSPHSIVKKLSSICKEHAISLIGHNIKYDLHVLCRYGFELPFIYFDTLIASWLLNAHERSHNLDDLARRHFNKEKIPIESLIGKGKNTKSMADAPLEEVATYCAEDVEYTLRLQQLFFKELVETKLDHLFYTVEMPLIPVLFRMEELGVYVNATLLEKQKSSIEEALSLIQKDIYEIAGKEFNINSPKILGEILFKDLGLPRQGRKISTSADNLEDLALHHPIAQKILEYRQLEKLRSTYLETLPQQVRKDSGRVHCRFIQSGTATGRLSCRDPNLQNIPIRTPLGKLIREAFEPQQPGWVYVSADYSQIELRILAHMSQDPVLVRSFNEGLDIHAITASELFNVPVDQVTYEMRQRAKAVNFGVTYGQQAYGLAKELKISTKEAQAFIDHYFARYQRVQNVIAEAKESAHKSGMAETITGRKRLLPDINSSDFFIRSGQERLAINTPFQGAAADIIKMAMIGVDAWLCQHRKKTKMILQIHDELLFEVPVEELDALLPAIKSIMESVLPLCVPLKVEISIGKNWKEC